MGTGCFSYCAADTEDRAPGRSEPQILAKKGANQSPWSCEVWQLDSRLSLCEDNQRSEALERQRPGYKAH